MAIFEDIFGWWLGIFSKLGSKTIFTGFPTPRILKKHVKTKGFERILYFLQDRSARRFWVDFAPFSDPRSDENRSPEVSERDPKKNISKCVWKASGSILNRLWDPTWILGGSPKAVLGVFCPLGTVLGGRWPQDAPRALPRPIWNRFWSIFRRFSMNF